jgi:hypothetical protein
VDGVRTNARGEREARLDLGGGHRWLTLEQLRALDAVLVSELEPRRRGRPPARRARG